MKAKLVYQDSHKRVYKLSEPFNFVPFKNIDLKKLLAGAKSRLKPEYQYLVSDNVELWDYVCISDAYTHVERLVFLGVIRNDGRGGILDMNNIDGKHTMMIDGGSSEHVYDDKVYLRRLAMANKLKFEGIDHE